MRLTNTNLRHPFEQMQVQLLSYNETNERLRRNWKSILRELVRIGCKSINRIAQIALSLPIKFRPTHNFSSNQIVTISCSKSNIVYVNSWITVTVPNQYYNRSDSFFSISNYLLSFFLIVFENGIVAITYRQ